MKTKVSIILNIVLVCLCSNISIDKVYIQSLEDYKDKSEKLLDQINEDWESFGDITMESDVYEDYINAFEKTVETKKLYYNQ